MRSRPWEGYFSNNATHSIMGIFFRKHIEEFLLGIALILIGVMLWCFIWGIIYVSQNLSSVFKSGPAEGQTTSFNLPGAENLNLRGSVPPTANN